MVISMESPLGKRFSSSLLPENFIVHWLPDNHGITAYDDDNNGNSWTSKRMAWKVTLKLADSVFEVSIIRRLLLNDRESFAIELDLVTPE